MVWPFFSSPEPKEDETFECDYERDCSTLYKAIESAIEPNEFDPIVKFLDTGYWSGSFFTDPISPADQARTWVTRFDPEDSTKVKWSQLPIHLAIVCGAPPAVIGRLVKLFPEGLRCTDDQHMLPLHLALRHNVSDEIVAFLLMQFPDAVNASGKSGRSAVECALRAKDKLRGKILEIFVSKSKGKMSSSILKEQKLLRDRLASKEKEVETLQSDLKEMAGKFESLKELKATVEADLLRKIQEVETARAEIEVESTEKIEKIENEKMIEALENQKKYESLEATLADIQASEKQAKKIESDLRKELDNIHARVARSRSPNDWESLKIDVGGMEAYRLQCSHTEAKNQIDMLKTELAKTLLNAQKTRSVIEASGSMEEQAIVDKELETDIELIRESVSKLEKDEENARSADDLNGLRKEVEMLRSELQERANSNKTKLELTILKKAMETELRNSQGKTKEELNMLRKAVAQASKSKLDNKTNAELVALKMDIEMLKRQTKNKELLAKTKTDLSDLRTLLEQEISTATAKKYREELLEMKSNADLLQTHLDTSDSTESIILLKKSVDHMKEELKKKESAMKIVDELASLKSTVETELKKSEGKTNDELLQVKKQIKGLTDKNLADKNVDELNKIKSELADVKFELQEIEAACNIQQELDALKKNLAEELKQTSANADKELTMMKKAVDQVNMEQRESKNLKQSLTEEIKAANKKTEQELLDMKKALDSLDVKKLESKNKEGWDAVRKEMDALKEELAAKRASKKLTSEIDSIKKVVEDLHAKKAATTTESEFKALREEMDEMRYALEQKDVGEAELKRELDLLKRRSEKKNKNGLSKFFTRHFTARKLNEKNASLAATGSVNNSKTMDNDSVSKNSFTTTLRTGVSQDGTASTNVRDSNIPRYAEITVTTIAPPSMVKGYSLEQASSGDSSEDEAAQATGQIMAMLSETFGDESMQNLGKVQTVTTDVEGTGTISSAMTMPPASDLQRVPSNATTNENSTTTKSFTTPKFRKVQSMDARITSPSMNSNKLQPIPTMRTFSRVIEEENGMIETVDTVEDGAAPTSDIPIITSTATTSEA
jgi:hypothetical protein